MRATIPIGIQPGTKVLRIERKKDDRSRYWNHQLGDEVVEGDAGCWIIWLHANHNFTLGTYLQLNDDGSILNTTVKEDGTEDTFTVKDADT